MENINTRTTLHALIESLKRKRDRQYQSYTETHRQITLLREQLQTMEPQPGDQLDIVTVPQHSTIRSTVDRVTEDIITKAKKGKS